MASKLDGNGRWQSKFIIPEHQSAIHAHQLRSNVKKRPTLFADEIEEIERKIRISNGESRQITLRMYDRYEDPCVIGVVERIDSYTRRIRVDGEWFRIDDVIGVDDGA